MDINPHIGITFEECYKKHKRVIEMLVKKHKYRVSGIGAMDKDDIEQIAILGFIKAYQKYDKGNFVQFARQMMKWEILNTLRTKRTTVTFPQSFGVVWSIASKRGLNIHNLDKILKLKPHKYSDNQVIRAMEWYGYETAISLDKTLTSNNNDKENDKTGYDVVEGKQSDNSRIVVTDFITSLTIKQKQVVRYLIDGKSQTEIAKLMDISQSQVCRIIKSLQTTWNKYEGCGDK